jgi:DNA-binding transcriptional ArsR family regulator
MAIAKRTPVNALVEVTPRFEIFYALQVLEGGAAKNLAGWKRDAEAALSARVRTAISSIAPCPLMWPLLADALRNTPPRLTFNEIVSALRKMSAQEFQDAVLSGVFKDKRSVSRLLSKSQTLEQVVTAESASRGKLLSLIGLNPFVAKSAAPRAFQRIISSPDEYRAEVISVVQAFWNDCFADTWSSLERDMERVASRFRRELDSDGFDAFAREHNVPVTGDAASTIYIIPSAFNASRLWATYTGARGRQRYFVPLTDPSLSLDSRDPSTREYEQATEPSRAPTTEPDASVVFKALGDTTRYAMASAIARQPMTSVELARMFDVSKPTISHHVQLLRAANLLLETPGENGVVLSLNRSTLERASRNAAHEMFSAKHDTNLVKRTRRG